MSYSTTLRKAVNAAISADANVTKNYGDLVKAWRAGIKTSTGRTAIGELFTELDEKYGHDAVGGNPFQKMRNSFYSVSKWRIKMVEHEDADTYEWAVYQKQKGSSKRGDNKATYSKADALESFEKYLTKRTPAFVAALAKLDADDIVALVKRVKRNQ
jgi:hypothetical protein